MKTVLFLLLSIAEVSHAETKAKAVFQDPNTGAQISVSQAVASDTPVLRCQLVKAEPNKAGTSITFKVVK